MSKTDVSRDQFFPGRQNRKLFYLNPPSPISESETWIPDQARLTETRTGSVTPGFRSFKRRKDDLPMNPFFYEKFHWDSPYGREEVITPLSNLRQIDVGSNVGGGWEHNPFVLTDGDRQAVIEAAANGLLNKLKAQRVNLGVALAERRQTADMIHDTAKRLGNALILLKRGQFQQAAKTLTGTLYSGDRPSSKGRKISQSKALANDWLALQFGWKPLLSDMWGALEVLAANADRLSRTRVSLSVTRHWNVTGDVFGGQWEQIPNNARRYGRFTAKYVVVFADSNPVLNTLSSLGITNPLTVAWEKLPWSFVVDWMIPIGRYIDRMDSTVGLSFEKGCLTTFEKGQTHYACFGRHVEPSTGREVFIDAKASAFRVRCVRSSISDFPRNFAPSFSPNLSRERLTSTLALIRQRLRS